MFTNLQNANMNDNSWLLKESRMCFVITEGMRNEIAFYEGKKK